MKKDNKIIYFDDAVLKREQKNYLASMKISLLYFPIIRQRVSIKTTLPKENEILETLVLLEEACKKLINKGVPIVIKPKRIGIQRFIIEFYMTSYKDIYFYSDTDDEVLMSAILISIATIQNKYKK